ncbi:flavodoxin [Clostridium tarantellae]|uniref:Flavodoxin n=1 Tax=Clostridium tarantellae TaxID=39493 RepID=A0A6I1MX21_9CLOT|nr:flavodoxin [Clostridium tarantellae]MPQ44709.1 flavodoxin [Clostridium tarantellae]
MKIIYWSGTGNTEEMAKFIAQGIEEAGKKAELINISTNNIDSLENEKVVVLGCPSMGAEELEESEFSPFLESIEDQLKGKIVVLFGSYGWGDGEWMRNWQEKMVQIGCDVPLEPVIVNYTPEGDTIDECINYGKEIASLDK